MSRLVFIIVYLWLGFAKPQVGLRSLPRSPYAGLGVRLWLLLVITFFGFFELKFRKKLQSGDIACQGSPDRGDVEAVQALQPAALSPDLRDKRANEMIDDCETGHPP